MPSSTEFIKPSTSELYQPPTENTSDDEVQDSPSPPKQQKYRNHLSRNELVYEHWKIITDPLWFCGIIERKLQKSQVQFENLESQSSKIGKSVTLLQSYCEKNVAIVQYLCPSGSTQTALDISAKHMNEEIAMHILKCKNTKWRKNHSSWIINIQSLAICVRMCVCPRLQADILFCCMYIYFVYFLCIWYIWCAYLNQ